MAHGAYARPEKRFARDPVGEGREAWWTGILDPRSRGARGKKGVVGGWVGYIRIPKHSGMRGREVGFRARLGGIMSRGKPRVGAGGRGRVLATSEVDGGPGARAVLR